jgi:hypothetical protein
MLTNNGKKFDSSSRPIVPRDVALAVRRSFVAGDELPAQDPNTPGGIVAKLSIMDRPSRGGLSFFAVSGVSARHGLSRVASVHWLLNRSPSANQKVEFYGAAINGAIEITSPDVKCDVPVEFWDRLMDFSTGMNSPSSPFVEAASSLRIRPLGLLPTTEAPACRWL